MVKDEIDRDKKGADDRKTLMQHGYTTFAARAMLSSHPQIWARRHSQASDRTFSFAPRGMDLTGRRAQEV
jgi:hypothetical protein